MTLRFKFKKYGPVVYIGHLDVMRYFQKVIRRTKIDAQYTEGFSPHLKLSFAQPLSVGIETDGDYFDLEMNSLPDMKSIVAKFNEQCVEGIEVLSATILNDGVLNAMSSVKSATYRFSFEEKLDKDLIEQFFSQEVFEFEYKQKDKVKFKDIMCDIYMHDIIDEYTMDVMVNCSSSGNLRADVITQALEHFGYINKCFGYKRIDLFTTNDNEEYVSLQSLGEIYD